MSKYLQLCEPRTAMLGEDRQIRNLRGFALALDFMDGYAQDARLLDRSEFAIDLIARTEGVAGDRARLRFVDRSPGSTSVRTVGDAFFADKRTAEFVWQACIEKIENDRAHLDRVAAGRR